MMTRTCLFVGVFLLSCLPRSIAEDAPTFKTIILPDSIRFVQAFSRDKQAGTLLFDNFVTGTEIGRGTLPSAETKTFTYVLTPVSAGEVSVVQQIRGYFSTTGSGSIAFVIHSGGETTLVDLTKATASAEKADRAISEAHKKAQQLLKESGGSVSACPNESNDFFVEFQRKVPAGTRLQTTISVLVDRLPGDDGSGAALHVDSIDFEVTAAKEK